jgi:hypothetical protein
VSLRALALDWSLDALSVEYVKPAADEQDADHVSQPGPSDWHDPWLGIAALDDDLLAKIVERDEPALPRAKPPSRARDADRADTEICVEPEYWHRPATLAAAVPCYPLGGLHDLPLKSVPLPDEPRPVGGHSVALGTLGCLLSLDFFEAVRRR